MIALTRIAYNFPDLIKVIVDWGVLEAARKAHDNQLEVYWSMEHLAKFLATICRGHGFSDDYNLSSEKVIWWFIVVYMFFRRASYSNSVLFI